jgi:c-di-GMP-binding flagellar brake protein YcgR
MSPPENLLYRSHIEICRILQVLAQELSPISAELRNGHPFASHILSVDPETGRFTIAYSGHKLINTMVLESPAVEFTATDRQDLHFSFEASAPEETQFDGQPAIQFALPKSLLLHNRREHPRIPVRADVSLRCIADEAGVIPFESHVTDISHDGVGCLIYDPDINLETGTILRGCRIVLPNGDDVVADLELRHATTTVLADGSLAKSAGFRFFQKTDDLEKLVKQFMRELDK